MDTRDKTLARKRSKHLVNLELEKLMVDTIRHTLSIKKANGLLGALA